MRTHRKDLFTADTTSLGALLNHVDKDKAMLNNGDIFDYVAASETSPSATVIKPANVDGAGRWVKRVADSGDFTLGDGTVTLAKLHAAVLGGLTIKTGSGDPSTGGGAAATAPAIYVRSNGKFYTKTGAEDTAWTEIVSA